ncbi:MAG: hypothetical protein JKY65_22975 [Planctomycetes bacterium]|nr:hypothetical protein [Planctomycetota bacterium]
MWEYKVIAGQYAIEGSDVIVENPLGRGTMQRILDHYTGEGFELIDSHFDNLNHEVILTLRKGAGSAVASAPAPAGLPQSVSGSGSGRVAALPDDDELPVRRRKPASSEGGRRSKSELDRLYRDS